MGRGATLAKALTAFIRYGFRKASMDDVARAVGVSRQALYQHFGSKAELFRDAVNHVLEESVRATKAVLADDSRPLAERLLCAFDHWAGQHVDSLRSSPHAYEVIDMASTKASDASQQAERSFLASIAETLRAEGVGQEDAADVGLVLAAASMGLLQTAQDRSGYLQGMRTVIRVVLARLTFRGSTVARRTGRS